MTARPAPPGLVLMVSLSTLLVFVVVVLSAYLRLKDAGLGCTDWPACFGQIGLNDNRSLAAGGALMPASAARSFHRIAAALLGFLIFAIAFLAVQRRRHDGPGVWPALLALALTIFLAVLGVVTPSPLVPLVTTANVLGGMAMLALLWWIGQRLQPHDAEGGGAQRLRPWARAAIAVVLLEIALGAWTSGSFAGPSCPRLDGCAAASYSAHNLAQGFAPARQLKRDAQGKVVLDDTAPVVHMTHRLGALVAFFYLGWLAIQARAAGGRLRTGGNALLALLGLQVALGAAGVAADLPLLLVTAHNAGAALLLLAVVHLNLILTPRTAA